MVIRSFSIAVSNVNSKDNNDLIIYPSRQAILEIFLKDLKFLGSCPLTILDFYDMENEISWNKFRKTLQLKSGIYMLKYKYDDKLFYIGKSVNLSVRLKDHKSRSEKRGNKLGLFLKTVGWKNVSVHIIEFCCDTSQLDNREDYYIKTNLPSLNRKFSSKYSSKVYRSLTGILKHRQDLNRNNNPVLNKNFKATDSLWVYTFPEFDLVLAPSSDKKLLENGIRNRLISNISRKTVLKYIDTNTPYRGHIYFSSPVLSTHNFSINLEEEVGKVSPNAKALEFNKNLISYNYITATPALLSS